MKYKIGDRVRVKRELRCGHDDPNGNAVCLRPGILYTVIDVEWSKENRMYLLQLKDVYHPVSISFGEGYFKRDIADLRKEKLEKIIKIK